ncbi:MAG: SDR family NAD(P)-dependent oxidoreductase [Candidatus Sumerlaeia bacterium]
MADYGKFLDGKVALVTGASRGIGKAVALALGKAGAKVVLAARNREKLESVAQEIQNAGTEAFCLQVDLGKDEDLLKIVPRVIETFGCLDILINNAGIGIYGPVEKAQPDEWDQMMRINARAPFFLCRDAICPMRKAGGGFIINIASVVGIKGYVNQSIYAASKHAMMGYSKTLAQEVQDYGIRVHTLCPGGVDTDMVEQARPDLDKDILMRPEEIAELILFLLQFKGKSVIDDLHIRRASGSPWF